MASRVTGSAGRNSRPPGTSVPVAMPCAASHAISAANGVVGATSRNGGTSGTGDAGDPAARYRNAAIASRRTGPAGSKTVEPPGPTAPRVIPSAASHSISVANGAPAGTSTNRGTPERVMSTPVTACSGSTTTGVASAHVDADG